MLAMAQPPPVTTTPKRVSVFRELGLIDQDDASRTPIATFLRPQRPGLRVRFRSSNSIINPVGENLTDPEDDEWEDVDSTEDEEDHLDLDDSEIVVTPRVSMAHRLSLLALFIAFALPIVQSYPYFGDATSPRSSARRPILEETTLKKRQDLSSTDVCARWSQQSALVNGTLYIYGGRASEKPQQQENTWNNYFVSLDLTKSWNIDEPSITGLPQPSGPPPVSNGFLWNSHDSLYLYGGEFSDKPQGSPTPFSLWEYDIAGGRWVEHEDPKTSDGGDYAEAGGQDVQRTAEGAGAGVAALGRGWYFGGHEDFLTTSGWDISIPRIYIKSLIEFTMPGYTNKQVDSLSNGQTAGEAGAWRNITQGGVQDSNGFPERADGLLVYVPGFADEGILLGLAGGTNQTFTQMNVIDVFDIATSTWYKQSTIGGPPEVRVNPCAVVAAAPDGSSYNMYMFGGQNLNATDNTEQDQYQDMWILSIPSFTWIKVSTKSQIPNGRSGHTCNVWDGQMIMVGGYTGPDASCDAPGIYVFNLTSLAWVNEFTSLTGSSGASSPDDDAEFNPFSQQSNQRSHESNGNGGLEGSYGYQVPDAIYSAVGGGPLGGATVTEPAVAPSSGPLATGSPDVYTVTGPNGEVITEVANSGNPREKGGSGTNIGAIVAGVLAGVFAIVAGYFAFCAWVYRKQLQLYKNHAAMAAAHASNENEKFLPPAAAFAVSKSSSERQNQRPDSIAITSGSHSRNGSSGAGGTGYEGRRSTDSLEDLLQGQEPSFWGSRGVLLNPRRSLRVINRD